MKKSLVLAMAMALGVTASAYAANPFSDVPAGHWAYDSVAKLAAEGVVDGYPDGTFGGDRLMTRYEMAQIVARAMAKGANVDRLAAEFADELDALGVRVARLEKNADNVRITAQIRYHYSNVHSRYSYSRSNLRTRMYVRGRVNDDWGYVGMFQNIQQFAHNNTEENTTDFQRAFVNGRIGGVKLTAGRYNLTDYTANEGMIYDTRFDGIEASYGKEVKLIVGGGKASDSKPDSLGNSVSSAKDTYYADLKYDFGKRSRINVGYYKWHDVRKFEGLYDDCDGLWNVGLRLGVAKDVKILFDYLRSDVDTPSGKNGYVIGLDLFGAKASKPGSFGITVKHYDQPAGTVMVHTMNGDYDTMGFKGWLVAGYYTFAKNLVGGIEWYDLKSKVDHAGNNETLWTQLMLTF